MGLFGSWGRPTFDRERIDWLFAHFGWLLENFGGHDAFFRSYHLIMPDRKDFPLISATDPDNVERVFRAIMKHMGMDTWTVKLVEMGGEDDPDSFEADTSELSMGYSSDGAAGYFSLDSLGRATIGYGPHLTSDFAELVSVLSHEASHYLITKTITVMPGGWKDLEPVTDLTAIFTGFGLFQANTASIVRHYGEGQSASCSGYLPESGRAYALAIFTELSLLDPKFVAKHLRGNPKASYLAAVEDIRSERQREMQELEELAPLREW